VYFVFRRSWESKRAGARQFFCQFSLAKNAVERRRMRRLGAFGAAQDKEIRVEARMTRNSLHDMEEH